MDDPDYGYDWMHVIAPEPGGGDADSDFDECPHRDPFHDHADGCPTCDNEQCPACKCIRAKLGPGEDCP